MATLGQSNELSRVVHTTIAEIVKDALDQVTRKRRLMAMMKERGLITGGHGGDEWKGTFRIKRQAMQAIADLPSISYSRPDRFRNWNLPWRGYAIPEQVTVKEEWMNTGAAAIVKYVANTAKQLMADAKDQLPEQLYIDGNATGNEDKWHGLQSCTGTSGANASAPIGTNNDTYAGISTVLANYGGTWSGSWPDGSGDPEYDAVTPLVVDYTSGVAAASGGWTATTKTWPNTCVEALRYGIIHGQRNDTEFDLGLMTRRLWREFAAHQEVKERINTNRSSTNSLSTKLGFNAFNFDGVDLAWEYGCPETQAYLLKFDADCMELAHLGPEMLNAMEVDFRPENLAKRFTIVNYGNMWVNPRDLVLLDNIT